MRSLWALAAAALLSTAARGQNQPQQKPVGPALAELLRSAGASSSSSGFAPPAAAPKTGSGVTVSLPNYDLWAVKVQAGLASPGVPLSTAEAAVARTVFDEAVDLESVRLVVAEVATVDQPMTLGNTIRLPKGYDWNGEALIHELTHVWQYQTRGASYISNSFLNQACALVSAGDRGGAYAYILEEGKDLIGYGAEQQAQIVEDYFRKKSAKTDPAYVRLIGQLRKTKAVKGGQVLLDQQKDLGPAPTGRELPLPRYDPPRDESGSVPQLLFRF